MTNSDFDKAQITEPLFDVPPEIPYQPTIYYNAVELLAAAILEGRVRINVSYGWTGDTRSVTSYKIVVYPAGDV